MIWYLSRLRFGDSSDNADGNACHLFSTICEIFRSFRVTEVTETNGTDTIFVIGDRRLAPINRKH